MMSSRKCGSGMIRSIVVWAIFLLCFKCDSPFSIHIHIHGFTIPTTTTTSSVIRSSSSSCSNDVNNDEDIEKDRKAYPQQPPHSERHFLPTHPSYTPNNNNKNHKNHKNWRREIPFLWKKKSQKKRTKRFFEGWYYRVTLPSTNESFAFIFSIEDPIPIKNKNKNKNNQIPSSPLSLATVQIMGPQDGDYLVECTPDHTKFWAHQNCQAFGCVFQYNNTHTTSHTHTTTVIPPNQFFQTVQSGFQMLPTRLQGIVANGHDGSTNVSQGTPSPYSPTTFDLNISPISGWGDDQDHRQKSTAGWLASHSVFEPHWQVTLADARVSGTITWKNKTYHITDAPFYAEKNWGGGFPIKWHWLQCNSFNNYNHQRLSITAVGAIRKLPLKTQETVGLLCIHYNGIFYEAVPWTGQVSWTVDPWGKWYYIGRCTSGNRLFEAEVSITCPTNGTILRAPTPDGMILACKDAFQGEGTLNMWALQYDPHTRTYKRSTHIIQNATTNQAAVEIGGGPWWDTWNGTTRMKQPFKSLVKIPYLADKIVQNIKSIPSNNNNNNNNNNKGQN